MHKVITFLGTYPKLTKYCWNDRIYEGNVFAEALRQFWEYDVMLVLTTEGAKEKTWNLLDKLNDPKIQCIPICDGKSIQEMWNIFDTVIDHVAEKDTVTFDITHGFRSLPFLAFLFAAYLKTARKVTIKAILYGALEMQQNSIAPVIDMTEFAAMLDWITATDQFIQTGDAYRLAGLLEPHHRNKNASRKAAQTLKNISQAAFLCQPFVFMEEAEKLSPQLHEAQKEFSTTSKPFQVLSEQIETAFGVFANPSPEKDPFSMLLIEYRLIDWYFDHNQLMQAVTLAREWLIDAVTCKLGRPLDFSITQRSTMERAISGLDQLNRPFPSDDGSTMNIFTVHDLNEFGRIIHDTWEEAENIRKLWSELKDVRNSLDHASHQKSRLSLDKLNKKSQQIRSMLTDLAEYWDIKPASQLSDE